MNWNEKETKKNKICNMPWILVLSGFIISFIVIGCLPVRSSVVYVPDSQRIELLDVNDTAPYKGVLLTEGYFFYLKECEGLAISNNLIR